MKLLLNENIRNNRKKMSLTQEQLAEAMGVSVATVSKWENGSVSPDIGMLAELAEFFQTSVDVLIGYQWEKRSADQCIDYMKKLCNERAYEEAIKEAKKALQKYPNQFKVVYKCADTLFASYLSLYRDEHGKHKPEQHLHDGFGNSAVNAVKMVFQCLQGEAIFDRLVSIFNDTAKVLEIESF